MVFLTWKLECVQCIELCLDFAQAAFGIPDYVTLLATSAALFQTHFVTNTASMRPVSQTFERLNTQPRRARKLGISDLLKWSPALMCSTTTTGIVNSSADSFVSLLSSGELKRRKGNWQSHLLQKGSWRKKNQRMWEPWDSTINKTIASSLKLLWTYWTVWTY